MKMDQPTIAFTIGMQNAVDGPYTQSYGLEMTIEEWPINIIIMSPPHLVWAMTEQVATTDAISGASYTPGDGDYAQIANAGGKWVLARKTDNIARILDAGLGVLLYVNEPNELEDTLVDDLDQALTDERLDSANLIIAFQINSISTHDTASAAAAAIREHFANTNKASCQILVSASFEHEDLLEYARLSGVSGSRSAPWVTTGNARMRNPEGQRCEAFPHDRNWAFAILEDMKKARFPLNQLNTLQTDRAILYVADERAGPIRSPLDASLAKALPEGVDRLGHTPRSWHV